MLNSFSSSRRQEHAAVILVLLHTETSMGVHKTSDVLESWSRCASKTLYVVLVFRLVVLVLRSGLVYMRLKQILTH